MKQFTTRKCDTIGNKIFGLVLIGLGALTLTIDTDATAFVFFTMFGTGLLFTKVNRIG